MTARFPASIHHGPLTAAGLCLVLAACGGGGGGDSSSSVDPGTSQPPPVVTGQASIDAAGIAKAIPDIATVVPICRKASATAEPTVKNKTGTAESALFARAMAARQLLAGAGAPVLKALGSTRPADALGSCGGRRTYPAYSHSNGTTTGTLAFDNYCSSDSSTGNRQVLSGSISFVNTGTPSANGPITTQLQANSPAGVTLRNQDSTGKAISSQTASFTNFVHTVGVPGASPTAAKPDVFRADEIRFTATNGQTYRETNYVLTRWETAGGGEQMTLTGRGYRSNGDFFDVSTTAPVSADGSGKTTGGEMTIAGANGSKAVMTVVPGSTMQATMTVNGVAVTNVAVCQ